MEVGSPDWQNLLRHLKIRISGLLDVKSRLALSLCSKSDHENVSDIPFIIDTFSFEKIRLTVGFIYCSIQFDDTSVTRRLSYETAISSFSRIVKNAESIIHHLNFYMGPANDSFYSKLLKSKELESNQCKIRAEKLSFNGDLLDSQCPLVLELLGLVDPQISKSLHLDAIPSEDFLNVLQQAEHWKNLEEAVLSVEKVKNLNLENFLHLNRVSLMEFKGLNNDHKLKIVENFENRNPPVGSFFMISKEAALPFHMMDTVVKTEKFELTTSGNQLYVEYLENGIQGKVVSTQSGGGVSFQQQILQFHSF